MSTHLFQFFFGSDLQIEQSWIFKSCIIIHFLSLARDPLLEADEFSLPSCSSHLCRPSWSGPSLKTIKTLSQTPKGGTLSSLEGRKTSGFWKPELLRDFVFAVVLAARAFRTHGGCDDHRPAWCWDSCSRTAWELNLDIHQTELIEATKGIATRSKDATGGSWPGQPSAKTVTVSAAGCDLNSIGIDLNLGTPTVQS